MNAKQQEFKRNVNILESLAAGSDCEDADEKRRLLNTCAAKMRESAQGHARYEALRCLNPRELHRDVETQSGRRCAIRRHG
jgi:hypothetical protein